MFKNNLKLLFQNSPLILSDTDDPKDISLTRVIIFIFAIATIIGGLVILIWFRSEALQFVGYWQAWLASFTTMVSGNIAKKIFNRGGNT
jgi:hypothetical protein